MSIDKAHHWSDINLDPTQNEVIDWRARQLQAARAAEVIRDRVDYLVQRVHGKKVLDIGVVEHTENAAKSERWLHRKLAESASTILGVDILEDGIKALQQKGFNVVCQDILSNPIEDAFEVIVCGELIEHLAEPQKLMASCKKMLSPTGSVLLTTPNPWYINAVAKNLISNKPFTDNVDHVAWFDPSTIAEMAEREGLRLSRYSGIESVTPSSLLGKLFFVSLVPILKHTLFNREVFCKSIVYELGHNEN
jgi:2-polyprenyl-3-methyl-5-hydroxy-6-metoxy-1,4-benzoquinol methylase